MQNGDLAVHNREQLVVILEGVLCKVVVHKGTKRLVRRSTSDAYHIHWYEIPLKRMVTIGLTLAGLRRGHRHLHQPEPGRRGG